VNTPKIQSEPVTTLAEGKLEMYVHLPDGSEIYAGLHIILSNIGLRKVQVVPFHALKLYSGAKEQLHSF